MFSKLQMRNSLLRPVLINAPACVVLVAEPEETFSLAADPEARGSRTC